MTVAQLIATLQTFDPDAIVSVSGYEAGLTDRFTVQQRTTVDLNHYSDDEYSGPHSEWDGTATRVTIER